MPSRVSLPDALLQGLGVPSFRLPSVRTRNYAPCGMPTLSLTLFLRHPITRPCLSCPYAFQAVSMALYPQLSGSRNSSKPCVGLRCRGARTPVPACAPRPSFRLPHNHKNNKKLSINASLRLAGPRESNPGAHPASSPNHLTGGKPDVGVPVLQCPVTAQNGQTVIMKASPGAVIPGLSMRHSRRRTSRAARPRP